jgi:hypothetical protein
MNERIKELAKQAGLEGSNGHYEYDWFDPDKFAKLIISECVRIDVENRDAAPGVEIAKHFGVKE